MQVYIVGGAVRDQLMNRSFIDKDFVVVGSTPQDMLDVGFIQVGDDFPVFLHPITKNEYALARTERKSGKGYKGFEVYAAPEVTIEQDLIRRDLTINAMAIEVISLMDDRPINGEVIDPYGGLEDLKNRLLRHVSSAFSEDPLRILRIARFYSRFYDSDNAKTFNIAPETLRLIESINKTDELLHLTAERVWTETCRAIMQPCPQAYFEILYDMGSLHLIMPKLAQILEEPNVKTLVLNALALSAQFNLTLQQRWTVLMYSFAGSLIQHFNTTSFDIEAYEDTSWLKDTKEFNAELKVPKKIVQFVINYIHCFKYLVENRLDSAESIAKIIASTKADKDFTNILDILTVQKVIELACQKVALEKYVESYKQIGMKDIESNLEGSLIGEALKSARIEAISKIMKKY